MDTPRRGLGPFNGGQLTVIIVALPEVFRGFEVYRMLAFGFMLMVLMIFRPHGLLTFERRREAEGTES